MIKRQQIPGSKDSYRKAVQQDIVWLLLRKASDSAKRIPGWAGFVSEIGHAPQGVTSWNFYPIILKHITQYATFQEVLE